jgi:hypothetical protein
MFQTALDTKKDEYQWYLIILIGICSIVLFIIIGIIVWCFT